MTTLLEASAGTGKTHRITGIVVDLVVHEGLPIESILVVTFTEAAAAELQGRVRSRLRDAHAGLREVLAGREAPVDLRAWIAEVAPDRRTAAAESLRRALEDFDRASISTIHGFCQRVLARFAFESGTPFGTRLAGDAGDVVRQVLLDAWTRMCADLPVPTWEKLKAKVLMQRGDAFTLLEDLAFKVISDPEQVILPDLLPLAPPDPGDWRAIEAWVLAFRRALAEEVRQEVPLRLQRSGSRTYDQLLTRLRDALRDPDTREGLITALRGTWSAALVDEFQDTDPVQWEVFETLFSTGRLTKAHTPACSASGEPNGLGRLPEGSSPDAEQAGAKPPVSRQLERLWLVGDPKQAIYSFRGADLHTYLSARTAPGVTIGERLDVNYRSDARLVRAVDHLFRRPGLADVFVDERVHADPIRAHHPERRLHGDTGAPLEIRLFPPSLHGGTLTRDWCEEHLPDIVARDVALALAAGWEIERGGVRRRVGPRDCAVLARTNHQAASMQRALRRHRIPSVLRDGESVLRSVEAASLGRVLAAILEPWRTGAVHRALLEPMFGVGLAGLAELHADDDAWSGHVERFRRWSGLWAGAGFVVMFRALLDEGGIVERLLAQPDGARRVTNLLHLGELLHGESTRRRRGPEALLAWLAAGGPGIDESDRSARLESDDDAVLVVTVHKSKGLEYPLVWAPFAWGGAFLSVKDKENLRFHDGGRRVLDLRPVRDAQKLQWLGEARQNALAEELRLAYVALTRARHRCVVYWSQIDGQEGSALAWMLHRAPGTKKLGGVEDRLQKLGWGDVEAEVRAIAAASEGTIGVTVVEGLDRSPVAWDPDGVAPALGVRELTRVGLYDLNWRRGSFSGLTAKAPPHGAVAIVEDEDASEHDDIEVAADTTGAELIPLHDVRSSAAVGQWVHEVLEQVDFRRPEQLLPLLRERAPAHGVPVAEADRFADALAGALRTPLDPAVPGLSLSVIAPEERIAELEFHLPVAGGFARAGSSLTPDRLADAIAPHLAGADLPAGYADSVRRLGFPRLHGFLYGLIDLVFVHQGRWTVVDHKTNHLGPTFAQYGPKGLGEAMASHHYPLQAILYSVAVRRWLRQRVRGWEDARFGGVAYLFLRGMAPPTGDFGVWRWRPPDALLDDLDALLDGRQP